MQSPSSTTPVILVNSSTYTADGPNGTVVVTFDEGAPALGAAPATGTFQPYGSLTNFNNQAPNGAWTLHIEDTAANDALCYYNAVLAITAAGTNAPVANADTYSINEDTFLLRTAANGMLSNDTDADGDDFIAVLDTNPAHGTLVTLLDDGSFLYIPDDDFFGVDTFTYHAQDDRYSSNIATVTINVTPVADPPNAVNDTYSVPRGGTLNIDAPGVLANDNDPDGTALTVRLARRNGIIWSCTGTGTQPNQGTVTLNADGSFTYVHPGGGNGDTSFRYCASDGTSTDIAIVNIDLHGNNNQPTADNDGPYAATEDTLLTVPAASGVLVGDGDTNGDTLTAVLGTGPSNGVLTFNANGSFSYAPNADTNGTDTFTYRAFDGLAYSGYATVTINVAAVNDAPVAVADTDTTDEDTAVAVNVLANDTDIDSAALTPVIDAAPAHGTAAVTGTTITYTPEFNWSGTDTFTYHANDGALDSNIVTVTINVAAVNDAPVADADGPYAATEDTLLTVDAASGVLVGDTDVEGDTLTAVVHDTPLHGTLLLNGVDGSFTYLPALDFNGSDSFTYHANDGALDSNVITVTINVAAVNDAPVADDDGPYAATEDTLLTVDAASGVLAGDTDVDGDTLTVVVETSTSYGTLTLNNNDGSFTYLPALDFNGSDSFTYHAYDSALGSNVITVTITVAAVNDAPVAVADGPYTTDEDTPVVMTVRANDTDVDTATDTLALRVHTAPVNGTLTDNGDGSFTYTPALNTNGGDSFIYYVNDGLLDSNTITVMIMVAPVNDPPVAVNDGPYAAIEDTALTVPAPGVLSNDSDPIEGSTLMAVRTSDATYGTVTLNADGSFTYTPTIPNYNGPDSFTYQAVDSGNAVSNIVTVTIAVAAVNDAPVANADAYTVNEDQTLTIGAPGVLNGDTDIDSAVLTAVAFSAPTNGTLTAANADGSFTYVPNANFYGTDTFTYQAYDGSLTSVAATVTITVAPVNDPPIAVNDGPYDAIEDTALTVPALGVLSNDSDPIEGSPLTAALVGDATYGTVTLNADGSFTYTPTVPNYNGPDSFTYQAADSGGAVSNIVTVMINVGAVNDAPTAVADTYTVNEDETLTIGAPGVLGNDSDLVEGGALTAALDSSAANGVLTFNSDGSFSYAPNHNWNGADNFTYHAIDDGNVSSNSVTVTLTVNPMVEIPVTGEDTYSTDESTRLIVPAPGVLSNDTIEEGAPLTAVLISSPTNGTLMLNADGSFDYMPMIGYVGVDTFTYHATDGITPGNTATVTIQIALVNRTGMYGVDDLMITGRDMPVSVPASLLLANDFDPDGDPLYMDATSQGSHGQVKYEGDIVTYTPDPGFYGDDYFTYTLSDHFGSTDSVLVHVVVWKPVPYCSDIAGEPNSQVYAVLPGTVVPTSANVFCRMLVENGKFLEPLSAGKIGDPGVLTFNIIQALDVFAMHYSGWPLVSLDGPVSICMRGQGNVLYMNVEGQPRTPTWVTSWEDGQGFTCATIPNAGTVILVSK